MPDETPRNLMQSAWALRRASFDAPSAEQSALMWQAREQLIRAVAMCVDELDPTQLAQAKHLLANVEMDLGHVDEAQSLWEDAIAILRGTDEVLQLAHAVRHLGDLHRHCKRTAEAERCFSEALTLYRRHDSAGGSNFANAVRRMALLQEDLGDRAQALALWKEARDLYAAADAPPGISEADDHISQLSY